MSDVIAAERATDEENSARTAARRKRWRRRGYGCAMRSGIGLATIVSVVGVVALIAYLLDARLPAEERRLARAAGAPLTIEEIEAYYPTSPEIEETTRLWWKAIAKLGSDEANELEYARRTAGVPFVGDQRRDDESHPPDRDARGFLQGEDLDLAREFVQVHREATEAAHEARRSGSVARFPLKWEDHIGMLLPHLQALRKFPDVLRLDMEVRMADGDVQAAVDDLLTNVAVGESVSNEPTLVSQFVRIACLNLAVESAERLLAQEGLTDEQLRQIGDAFARQDFPRNFRRALSGERWMFVYTFDRGTSRLSEFGIDVPIWYRGEDQAKGLELYRLAYEASQQGLLEAQAADALIDVELAKLEKEPLASRRYAVTGLMFPSLNVSATAHLRGAAFATLVEAAVACERYRLAHGDLPAKLDDLVPEYLDSMPLDPFDEQPLRYVVDAEGARLYSIGQDLKDDGGGGAVSPQARQFQSNDDVFRLRPSQDSAASP